MATTDGTRKATPHDGSRTNGQVYARVGTKGQFVVPAKLRQELHIEPGQRVRLEAKDGKLIVTPLNGSMIQRLRGILAGPGLDPLAELMREHQEEIEREEAQEALWREREREKAEKERERAERPPRDVLQEFLTRRDRGE
jgi:AbrB family looped-hinge helix DNA binding protein